MGYLFLLGVLLVASLAERGPILFGALLSTFIWNYGFIPPRFTFRISETTDAMMCVAYLAVAIAGSLLTTKVRRQQVELQSHSRRMTLLYHFTRAIASAADISEIRKTTAQFTENTLLGRCAVLLRKSDGELEASGSSASGFPLSQKALAVAKWVNEHASKVSPEIPLSKGAEVLCVPLNGTKGIVGVLVFLPEIKQAAPEQESILESVAAASAIAIERQLLQESVQKIQVFEESQKLYETILDSVSHELRTPITAIIGAASALSDKTTASIDSNRVGLTEDLVRSAERLDHVVENLLDMSRLSSGKLELKKELVEISDFVEEAVRDFKESTPLEQKVLTDCESGLYAQVDSKMMENVLTNLLRNAAQYSPPKASIQISASRSIDDASIVLDVLDEGKGISHEVQEKVFQKFYREAGSPAGGVGLGLSIVKGIVEAHGGKVAVSSREDKMGSRFRVTLPMWKEKIPENL